MSLTIALLAYNEAENLKWIIPEIKKQVESLNIKVVEYLVVDSMMPTDNSKDVCEKNGVIYVNQEEPFYGGAMRTAFKYASCDYFMILDADGSQDICKIPELYREFNDGEYDVVIGSRYVYGGTTEDSKLSQIMSYILNWFYTRAMGIKVKDVSDSFRIYNTNDLKKLYLECNNFDIAEEILFKLKLIKGGNLKTQEVPIKFVKREIGESKRSLVKFIISYGKTLFRFLVLRIISKDKYIPVEHDKKAKIVGNFCFYFIGMVALAFLVLIFIFIQR